jgi:dolichol-phosphate mannosyltransferase
MRPDLELLPLHQRPAVAYSLGALLLGGQLMSIGFLAELIIAYQGRDSDTYSIVEQTSSPELSAGGNISE